MNKIINKKATAMFNIALLIISILTLVLLIYLGTGMLEDGQYQNSLVECSYFFQNVQGKSSLFTNLGIPNNNLINSLAGICSSKSEIISKKEIFKAADLISDCYKKSANGVDIFSSKLKKNGICLYCGSVKSNNRIDDFSTDLDVVLKKNKYKFLFENNGEVVNLNSVFLNKNSMPSFIEEDKGASIYYYIFKPEFPKTDDISFTTFLKDKVLRNTLNLIGNQIVIPSFIESRIYPDIIQTYSGVIITDQLEYNEGEDIAVNRNSVAFRDCSIIIPKKNFD